MTIYENAATSSEERFSIEEAVAVGNVPVLLMMLYQVTGDETWLEEPYRPTRPRGLGDHDTGGLDPEIQQEIRLAALEVLKHLQRGGRPVIPLPSEEQVVRMMSVFLGEDVGEEYGRMMREELSRFAGQPLDSFDDPSPVDFEVIVIGMSVAGTAAAKHLQEMGVPFTILERRKRSGGSWLDNHYPGAGVDTPSHLYSFSFANHDWQRHFTLRDDLIDYFDGVLEGLSVEDRVRYDTEVIRVTWDPSGKSWTVDARHADGSRSTYRARFIITAVGIFGLPKMPELPGRLDFAGEQFHPADWPDDLDLSDKRVVVVGTGASAMQIVPAIAGRVKQLTVLQRSPQWVAPFEKFGQEITPPVRQLLAEFPLYRAWYWLRLFWQFGDKVIDALRADPNWEHPERAMNARNDAHRQFFLRYIEQQVGDRTDLLDKVVPDYPPFGKRILLDNGWYQALKLPHVELIAEAARSVSETGLTTESGTHIDADVIVWSTGYDANRFLASFEVNGVSGQTIRDAWDDDDPRTYLGIATPGFPNLFMLGGPHSFPGAGSFMFFMELQMRYIRRLLGAVSALGAEVIEPRQDATDRYNEQVDELHDRTVWTHPKVQTYFRNSKGRVCVVMPFLNSEYWNLVRDLRLEDYVIDAPDEAATTERRRLSSASAGRGEDR